MGAKRIYVLEVDCEAARGVLRLRSLTELREKGYKYGTRDFGNVAVQKLPGPSFLVQYISA